MCAFLDEDAHPKCRLEGRFLARRWPWIPVADVTELPALVETERALLARGVVGGVQTTTGSVRRGETHWVYGRYRRPCRRCTTPITFRESAGTPWARETWWCPRCQPAPARADRRRLAAHPRPIFE